MRSILRASTLALFLAAPTLPAAAQDLDLEGRVVDEQDQVVAGAAVTLTTGAGQLVATSDERGEFHFPGLAAGRYQLQATAGGFAPVTVETELTAASSDVVVLRLRLANVRSEITVTSSLPELATSFEVPSETIAAAGGEDLAGIFREVAGMSAVRRGPLNLEPNIRGLQEEQVGMFVDGTRTFAAGPGRMDSNISHVNTHNVHAIQVVKGPYALSWGAGTLSALEVKTSAPEVGEGKSGFTLAASYGENAGSEDLFADAWQSRDRWSWALSMGRRSGDDYEAGDGSTVPGDYDSSNVRGSLAFLATDRLLLTWRGSYQEQNDIDYPGRQLDATYFYHRGEAAGFTWSGDGRLSEVAGQLYVNRKDHLMNNDAKPSGQPMPGRVPPFALRVELPTESNTAGGRLRAKIVGGRSELSFGTDYYKLDQAATRTISRRDTGMTLFQDVVWPDATLEDLGGFAQATLRRGRVQLGLAGRLDLVDASAGELSEFFRANAPGDPEQSESHLSGAVDAHFDLSESWSVHLGAGRAVRTATVLERYSDRFPTTKMQLAAEVLGNPELDAEKSLEWNAGIRGRAGNLVLEAEAFYRELDDYITVVPAPGVPKRLPLSPPVVFRYINSKATFYGGELVLTQRLSQLVSWHGSLSYVRADDEELDEPALGVPPLGGELTLRLHPLGGRLRLDLAGRFADRQDRVATSRFEQVTPGWTVYDVRAAYEIGERFTLRAAVENLTDRAYANHLNSPNPFTRERILEIGRNFLLGFEVRLGSR